MIIIKANSIALGTGNRLCYEWTENGTGYTADCLERVPAGLRMDFWITLKDAGVSASFNDTRFGDLPLDIATNRTYQPGAPTVCWQVR